MHDFVRNLITEWRRLGLPFGDCTVVVAVSGGADSVSLLLGVDELRMRKKLDLRIVAAHFDHRLRPDSRSDLEFVRELAGERKLELAHGEWRRPSGGNLEQSARAARYDFLLSMAERLGASHVLTAHTMNDQAETVLMNLIRGSGPEGLGGMHPTREMKLEIDTPTPPNDGSLLPFPEPSIVLARPLVRWAKRRDTENFCRENEVAFTSDPMNDDLNFRRVWVRKALIPMLQEANPKIVETLCRTAELLREPASPAPPPEVRDHPTGALDLKHLRTLSKNDLLPILRDWIRLRRGGLRGVGMKHVEAVADLIRSAKSGRVAELPGGSAVKHDGRLEWHPKSGEKA